MVTVLPYGRYVISFNKHEKLWKADYKFVHVKLSKSTTGKYTFVSIDPLFANTKDELCNKFKQKGAGFIRKRKNSWVVYVNDS